MTMSVGPEVSQENGVLSAHISAGSESLLVGNVVGANLETLDEWVRNINYQNQIKAANLLLLVVVEQEYSSHNA